MPAGRPKKVDPGALYAIAHMFYWEFRRIAEGRPRRFLDKAKLAKLDNKTDRAKLRLSPGRRARLDQMADAEIRSGRLDPIEKNKWLGNAQEAEQSGRRSQLRRLLAERATKHSKFPGEPDVIKTLLDPKTSPQQVRELCKEAFMTMTVDVEHGVTKEVEVPAWPILSGSTLPHYLSLHAEEYVAALRDPRFPDCDVSVRPTNRLKQLWFLSRALAGAIYGVKTRTALNLVGSKRPEEVFEESGAAKPARKQKKRKAQSRFT